MSLPIFSVVIPVYNVEKYLNTCIDSVLAQTFQNFEIICVNDGSTDSSLSILQSYCDYRIRIVNQDNQGLAAARNSGINAARGVFIALLDADDYWLPEKLVRHYAHFQHNPKIDVSYSPSLFVNEQNEQLGIGQYPKLEGITPEHIYCRNPVGNGSAPVIRRSLLQRVSERVYYHNHMHYQYFDETMRQSEDVEFWLRCALKEGAVFEGIPQALTCYRVNEGGLSSDVEKQLKSWRYISLKMTPRFPVFFKKWHSLAEAYQKRYLARRAVHSGDGLKAIVLIHGAIFTNPKILCDEPVRTYGSYMCAYLSLLPKVIYAPIEKFAMMAIGGLTLVNRSVTQKKRA